VLRDVARALDELRDPAFWGVAAKSVGLTAGLLVASFWGFGWLLGVGEDWSFTLPWIGAVAVGGGVGTVLWVVLASVASAVLMLPVAAVFIGVFLDAIVDAVERRNYPLLPPATPVPVAAQLRAAASLFAMMLALNVLGLAIWALLPPLAPAAFVALNGWLIGREYFETVALRRMDANAARTLRRRWRWSALGVGALVAAALALPLANLFAPLLGVAAMTHLVHRARASA
jgi:uncharacterized protein involved in cysteine biosynthesis